MIILHQLDEEALEAAFWEFDTERRKTGAERDAFKHQVRKFARHQLERAGVQHDLKTP